MTEAAERFRFRKISFDDTRREKLFFIQFTTRMAASDLFHMITQSIISSIYFIIMFGRVQMFQNVIHQKCSKNEWLLLSASYTAKFGLVFVLTLESAFS